MFTIFHRLNTGAVKLNNQEIRNAIYQGNFNHLLKELNKNSLWGRIAGIKKEANYRFAKEELILRFFAFAERYQKYQGKLAKFLNDYMNDNKEVSSSKILSKQQLFNRTVEIIDGKILKKKSSEKFSNVVLDALMFGVQKKFRFFGRSRCSNYTRSVQYV